VNVIKFILTAWSLGVVWLLLLFLARIAYFYEKTAGQRVGYFLPIVPAILLAAGTIWYLVKDVDFIGESAGDLLLLAGGLALILFGAHLQEVMTGEKR